jgi:hypothetical protein
VETLPCRSSKKGNNRIFYIEGKQEQNWHRRAILVIFGFKSNAYKFAKYLYKYIQGFESRFNRTSGSGSRLGIRIQTRNPDPDPGKQKDPQKRKIYV